MASNLPHPCVMNFKMPCKHPSSPNSPPQQKFYISLFFYWSATLRTDSLTISLVSVFMGSQFDTSMHWQSLQAHCQAVSKTTIYHPSGLGTACYDVAICRVKFTQANSGGGFASKLMIFKTTVYEPCKK